MKAIVPPFWERRGMRGQTVLPHHLSADREGGGASALTARVRGSVGPQRQAHSAGGSRGHGWDRWGSEPLTATRKTGAEAGSIGLTQLA